MLFLLKALEFFKKGSEYIVSEGRVILIDEATGRIRDRSRYEEGLHQALEAKEKLLQGLESHGSGELPVCINPDNYTIANITFQVLAECNTSSTAAIEVIREVGLVDATGILPIL